MLFKVKDIKDAGIIEKEENLSSAAILGVLPSFIEITGDLKVKAHAQLTHADVVISGTVSTTLRLACARCLEKFSRPLKEEFQDVYSANQLEIDIAPLIKESILVDLPMKAVCKEECQGLCLSCGQNKNNVSCACVSTAEPMGSRLITRRIDG